VNDFTFYNPTHFVFGKNVENSIGKYMKERGFQKALIVYGQGSVVRSGLLDRVKASLSAEDISFLELSGIVPNPLSGPVYEGIELVKKHKIDVLVGLGGASAIDTAKAIAFGALYDGDFWDFYARKAVIKASMPVVAVPTIAAAGSESSNSSVITKEDINIKRGVNSEFIHPTIAIMNPELTYTVPKNHKAYGVCDMMTHIFERYFTNTKDVNLTDEMCEGVLRAIMLAGPKVLSEPYDYAAHADIFWAGTIAHNNTLSTGREQDWSVHAMAHSVSAHFNGIHGAVLAVLYPYWMEYQLPHDVPRFARFAHKVMGVCPSGDLEKAAKEGIQKLRNFFDSLNLPNRLGDFGAEEKDIPALVRDVEYRNQGRVGFFRPLSPEDVEKIFRMAL
jgi:alcohol dehydrogenase YqhD (iron-dependent ADH family)